MEHGVKLYPEKNSAFLQVGGISYHFDPKQKEEEKITDILKDGEPLDLNKKYVVATNDYIASGGDEFPCFSKEPILKEFGSLESIVIKYIEYKKEISKSIDGRISIKSKDGLISNNHKDDFVLSENKVNINDDEGSIPNNDIENSDSDKNKKFDKRNLRESSTIGVSKREAKEKSPKTGDLGFSNSMTIFIVSSTLIYLLNFNQKDLKSKKSK